LITIFAIVVPTLPQPGVGPSAATKPASKPSIGVDTPSNFSLKNNITFSPSLTQRDNRPTWILTEWIQASPEHLLQIKYVISSLWQILAMIA
jgi:hypothetical protein